MAPLALSTRTTLPLRASAYATRSAGASRRVMVVRAFRDEENSDKPLKDVSAQVTTAAEETFDKIKAYWDASEEKPTIVATGAFALLALYFTNSIVTAVDHLPLISTLFELVGLAYTGYTAYKIFLVPGEKEALTDSVKGFVKKVGIEL